MWAWEAGVTPHAVIRTLGPWGPRIANGYVRSRFSHHGAQLSDQEGELFAPYLYRCACLQRACPLRLAPLDHPLVQPLSATR